MLRSFLRPLAGVAAAAALLCVAACGGGDDPAAGEASTTPAATGSSATTAPGPVEPTLPAAAQKPGKAGAEAFVEYYWAVVDYAVLTGDTAVLDSIQADTCVPCEGGALRIREIDEAGGEVTGGAHRVSALHSWHQRNDAWLVQATVSVAPQRVSGAGKLNSRTGRGQSTVRHTVLYQDKSWSMFDWDVR